MFHFPTFPPLTLCVQVRVTGHDSSWVSPFGHPRITARLPTPRGLSQAPTSFIGSWCQGIHRVPLVACLNNVRTTQRVNTYIYCYKDQPPHHNQVRWLICLLHIHAPPPATPNPSNEEPGEPIVSMGCSRPLSRSQTTTPPTPSTRQQPGIRRRRPEEPTTTPSGAIVRSFRTQQRVTTLPLPTNCSLSTHTPRRRHAVLRTTGRPGSSHSSTIPLVRHHHAHPYIRWASGCVLLRKEVIQPHLPVRLPCYDFVPIASPTFDGSLHKGWATGFGCCRLS